MYSGPVVVLVDIDGVISDGKSFYDQNNKVIAKSFNTRDFTAIKRFQACGIQVAFVSGDPWNKEMAISRKIDFWDVREFAPNLDKSKLLPSICEHYLVNPSQILFCGDDIFDNTLLYDVGFKYCPADACYATQMLVGQENVLTRRGGEGCVDSLFHICQFKYGLEEKEYPAYNQ